MKRKSFILYEDWFRAIDDLPIEQQRDVYRSVCLYAFDRIIPDDPVIKGLTALMRSSLDRAEARYEAVCERNRRNGQLGGAPVGNSNASKQPKQPSGLKNNPNNPKQPDNDNEKGNDKDNDKDNDNENQKKALLNPLTPLSGGMPPDGGVSVTTESKEKKTEAKKPKQPKPGSNIPPTLEEVQARIAEKGYSVDAEQFWNFYESKGWRVGNSPMKNWHSALVTWQKSSFDKPRYGTNNRTTAYVPAAKPGRSETSATGPKDYQTKI